MRRDHQLRPYLRPLEDRITPAITTTDLTQGLSAVDLVNSILGVNAGVTVDPASIKITGANRSLGVFSGGNGIIGFDKGIVLTSGEASLIVGPNTENGKGISLGNAGDVDLTKLVPQGDTNDATVLEFDFVPQGDRLRFKYVFGSEEYNEFVNSAFNDVFAFFVNGVNSALIPGKKVPVAINTVNNGNPIGTNSTNPQFYVNNAKDGGAGLDTELDGLTRVLPVSAKVNPGVSNHIKIAIADTSDGILDSAVMIQAGTFSAQASTPLLAVGADAGADPRVNVYNPDGNLRFSFLAFKENFRGGVRVATGDTNGDNFADIIAAAGPGGGPHVKVFDGKTGAVISSFFAFDAKFRGGVYVAAGDLSDTGVSDVVVGAGPGGGPHVKVFNTDLGFESGSFYAFDPSIPFGVRVTTGDFDGDGTNEVATSSGPGSYAQVKVFNLAATTTPIDYPDTVGLPIRFYYNPMPGELASFFVTDAAFRGGVFLAAGDVNGDKKADLIVSYDQGPPTVTIYDVANAGILASYNVFDPKFLGGVRLAATDLNGDKKAELVVGGGPGSTSFVSVLDPLSGTATFGTQAFAPAFIGGVFVG